MTMSDLEARCRSRIDAMALASSLGEGPAEVAVQWATAHVGRRDLALAPLCASAAPASMRVELARRRLREGPLHDALACVPTLFAAGALDRELRLRVDALAWELAARGESDAELSAWLNRQPDAVDELILGRARASFAEQLRAANLLSIAADGIDESLGVAAVTAIVNAATRWLEHPEPLLWRVAARALGRLAHRTDAARRAQRDRYGRARDRRRVAAALAATPPASGSWAENELERALASDDPWLVAALAVSAPYLSRERPAMWEQLLDGADNALPVAWSVANGLAMIGRRGGMRSLSASEQAAAAAIRARLVREVPRATTEASLSVAALTALDMLDGGAPPGDLCFETHDHAIRAGVAVGARGAVAPAVDLDGVLAALGAADEHARGHAHLVLRSMTRAHAARTSELVATFAPVEQAPVERIADEITMRLAAHVCEYGLRSTLVECAGDLVDAAPRGSRRGHAAASALRSVIGSVWHLEHGTSERDVRSFRKPLADLIRRCTDDRPLPPLLAWWVLAGGAPATIAALKLDDVTPATIDALRRLDRSLRDAALGASRQMWEDAALAALADLGTGGSAFASALRRLVAALASHVDDPPLVLAQLTTAIELFVTVMQDVDAVGIPDVAREGTQWSVSAPDAPVLLQRPTDMAAALARWQLQLSPLLFAIVAPVARALAQRAAATDPPRNAGARIGGFELVERLGGGGFGEVWKARRDGQLVALKLPLAGARAEERALFAETILGEAGRLAGISTAKVVTLIDRGSENGMPYLATSYLRGRTWFEHALVAGARMSLALAMRVAREACVGLANLHEMQIVHRDVTPRNIFLRFRGADPSPIPTLAEDPLGRRIDEVVLIDLGISQRVGDRATPHLSFGYVAPEILDGSPVGPAADVYGLAASLFHVLTGTRFAAGLSRGEALRWHLETSPFDDAAVAHAAAKLPEPIARLLAAATTREPAKRATLDEVEQALA